jgi:ATP-dependent helicase/nuclease subunit A
LHDPVAKELWIVDWKTNRRRRDETDGALLARLVDEYAPQLRAYGACAAGFFAGVAPRLLVFSSAVGNWQDVPPG